MRAPGWLTAVLGWLALVVLASAATWAVVGSVGAGLLSRPAPQPQAVVPLPSASPRPSPTRSPSPPPSPSPSPSPVGQLRSWRAPVGTVVVRCRAGRISLQSATPADGYRVSSAPSGASGVEVTFGSVREDQAATRVAASCAGDVPRFAAVSTPPERDD